LPRVRGLIEPVPVRCPSCGELVEISVDPSAGALQDYTEDCPVCCRPWKVRVRVDEWGDPQVDVAAENE
jgi:cysteine-rich CPXCG protein